MKYPLRYSRPFDSSLDQQLITSFALARSGQHVVIDWICRGMVQMVHLNHCRFFKDEESYVLIPVTGRRVVYQGDEIDDSDMQGRFHFVQSLPDPAPQHLIYSVENVSPRISQFRDLMSTCPSRVIMILRDPANWLASSLKRQDLTKEELANRVEIFNEMLEMANAGQVDSSLPLLPIDYNRFILQKEYRLSLAQELEIDQFEKAEQALSNVPDFGGGSSFDENSKSQNTLERWKDFQDDKEFRSILEDEVFISRAKEFFGELPGIDG